MTAPLENPEVDLTLLLAARTLGAAISFAGAWFAWIIWNHSASPVLEKLAGIGIKFVGHPFGFLHGVNQSVKNFLTGVMAGTERAMVHALDALLWKFADIAAWGIKLAYNTNTAIDNIWHNLTAHVTKVVTHTIVRPVTNVVRTTVAVTKAQFSHLTHRVDAIRAQVAHLTHSIAHLTVAAGHAIATPFPRIGHLEREVANDAKRLGKLEKKLGAAALAGLVTAALTRLGLGALRCSGAKRMAKNACRSDLGWLDELFAGAVAIIGTASLIEFIKDAQSVEDEAIASLHLFIREFNKLDLTRK